jgi:CRP/FNR family transcriptional regulator, cyclic AMP receptor protein
MMWIEGVGYVGTALVVASTAMTTIIPLRITSICASAAVIVYGHLIGSWPVIVTELFLVPLNAYRLWQMWRLLRRTEEAAAADLSLDWLRPFGRTRRFNVNKVVFRIGDPAGEMYYVETGLFHVPELGITVRAGASWASWAFSPRGTPGRRRWSVSSPARPCAYPMRI